MLPTQAAERLAAECEASQARCTLLEDRLAEMRVERGQLDTYKQVTNLSRTSYMLSSESQNNSDADADCGSQSYQGVQSPHSGRVSSMFSEVLWQLVSCLEQQGVHTCLGKQV